MIDESFFSLNWRLRVQSDLNRLDGLVHITELY